MAHSGEPGGDTWNNLPDMMRQGGETWIAGSYDPDTDLTFWGIAQAKPWMPASRGNTVADAALALSVLLAILVFWRRWPSSIGPAVAAGTPT